MSTACVPAPLSGTQLKIVGALLAGRPPADIARECGISPRTLREWQRQPGFRAALLEGQSQLLHQTYLELAAAASDAIRTLVEICQGSGQKGSVRVAAAGKILDLLFRNTPQVAALLATPQPGETAAAALPSEPDALEKLSRLFAKSSSPATSAPSSAPPEPELAALPAVPNGAPHGDRGPLAAHRPPRSSSPCPPTLLSRACSPLCGDDLLGETRSGLSLSTRIPVDPALPCSR